MGGQTAGYGASGTTNNLAGLNQISQDTLRAYGFNDFTSVGEPGYTRILAQRTKLTY